MRPVVADEATITAMILAFNTCQSECQAASMAIEGARGQLGSAWQSDQAAPRFLATVDQWLSGFHQVRQGLDQLNNNMQHYSTLTATTEDDNTGYSGGWAG